MSDLIGPVVGVEAADGLAITGGGDVDDDVVAGLRRPLDVLERAEPLPLAADLGVDLVVRYRQRRQLDAQAAIAGQGDLRAHLERGVEGDGAILPAAGDLDLGGVDDIDVVLSDRLGQVLRDGVAQRLLPCRSEADAGFENADAAPCRHGMPGSLTSLAILRNARSISRSNSASSIVTESLTLLPSISCSEEFTGR